MRLSYRFVCCLAGVLLATTSHAAAGYLVEPIAAEGTFTPVTITDDGTVAGTLASTDGSLALITDGHISRTYDFCGVQGAADHTVLTATSPYSAKRFMAGDCGNTNGFVYDVGANSLTVVAPASTSGVGVAAVGSGGLIAGIIDTHSGGNTAFYDRKGSYKDFYPGEFANITQITVAGLIVGFWSNLGGMGGGFTYKPGGVLTMISPPAQSVGNQVWLYGGNRRGQLAATVVDPAKNRAAIWQSGHFTYAPLPSYAVSAAGRAINENGDVAGILRDAGGVNHVFVWRSSTGKVEIVPSPSGVTDMSVTSINNHADITGSYTQAGHQQAYLASCRPRSFQ